MRVTIGDSNLCTRCVHLTSFERLIDLFVEDLVTQLYLSFCLNILRSAVVTQCRPDITEMVDWA